jgi:hypothetical protein
MKNSILRPILSSPPIHEHEGPLLLKSMRDDMKKGVVFNPDFFYDKLQENKNPNKARD